MPFPIIPVAAGLASLAGTLATNISARKRQKTQQAQDVAFWEKQNEYNNPQNQMRRLQTAGLNPNLVYGQSAGGAAGHAEQLKTPDVDPSSNRFIDPSGMMQTIGQYADYGVKQAQTDNLKANTQVAQENAILTAQKSYGEGVRNAQTRFDLNLAEELRNTSLEASREQLRKLKIDNQYTLNQNERSNISTATNTAEAVERILSQRTGRELTKAQTANIRADNELKELDKKLAKMGIRPSDPFYATAIARFLMKYSEIRQQQSK